jgi:hypothetical protein
MRIRWVRVLLAGLLIEVILAVVLIGGFAAAGISLENDVSTGSSTVIGLGCFIVAFLVTLWFGRRIDNRLVLHGFLIGLAATLLYVGLVAGAGQMSAALAAYGPATFVLLNGVRVLGAVLGGVVCAQQRSDHA